MIKQHTVSKKKSSHSSVNSKRQSLLLLSLCLGYFMVIMDTTIVNVALPSIAENLGGSITGLQWIMDSYALTFAGFLLSAGYWGDLFGSKTLFQWGLISFIITSLGCGISHHLEFLICFRLLQGISAAFIVPTSLALINFSYPDTSGRAKAIGVWGGIGGIAAASGPLLGGILASMLTWRAVFFVNIPFGIMAFLLTNYYINNPPHHRQGHLDFIGQFLGILSIGILAFTLIEVGRLGWISIGVIMGFCLFLISTSLFLIWERKFQTPMFPLELFRSYTFSAAIAVGIALNLSFYGELFLLPFYFEYIKHYSVLITGLAILPQMGIVAITSYLAGKVISRIGYKLPMVLGLGIGSMGFFTLLLLKENSSYLFFVLPLMAIGFGMAFTMPAVTVAAMNAVSKAHAGLASGALNTGRQVGGLIGIAVFGSLINMASNFIKGMQISLCIGGIVFLGACFITCFYIENAPSLKAF